MSQTSHKEEMQHIAEMLKAMAHPDRLAILRLLRNSRDDRLTVKVIYEKLNLQQPIASRHLNILKSAGVVKRRQEGQKTYYCICNEKKTVESLTKCLG